MYEEIIKYAETNRQREIIEAMIAHGSLRKVSLVLNTNRSNVREIIGRVKRQAAAQGWSPEHDMTKTVPDSYSVKGVSSYYNADGELSGQWVKSFRDTDSWKDMMDALNERTSELMVMKPVARKSTNVLDDLLNMHVITDYHLGMLSWPEETGAAWDMEIASQVLVNAMADMLKAAPKAADGLLIQLGDFLHFDSKKPVTPASGHILDTDSRAGKLIGTALDLHVTKIQMMLQHYENVYVMVMEGNHDEVGSIWLRKSLIRIFSDNPRVHIYDYEFPYAAHLHGKCMISAHHGHKRKLGALPELFASEPRFREMWGQAKICYVHTGHLHHNRELRSENGGAIVEQHPTLAGRDAYASSGGWVAEQRTTCITYHKEEGEICRHHVRPRMS